jgi:hypothetical protein
MLVVLRRSRSRRAARCVGYLRAVLGHGESCGLHLRQAEAPSTVAQRVISFEPESHCWGSDSSALVGWGWVAEMDGCVAGCAHLLEKWVTDLKNAGIHRLSSC